MMIEDYTNVANAKSRKKAYALLLLGSETFNPAQMKYSVYAKEFLGL